MKQVPFSCARDALTIRGMSFLPEAEGPHPAAILCHGFMSRWQDMIPYAETLAKWGYAAFAFDFCGGSLVSTSDGATTEMTVLTERDDLLCVMDAVLARPDIDPTRLVLMGGSQGGFVASLAAAERPEQVTALMLLFPALCIPDDARRGALLMASYDPACPPSVIHCGPMPLGRCFHDTAVGIDPFAAFTRYSGPVLLLHGTADSVVIIDYARRAQQACAPGQCRLVPIQGAGHGFNAQENELAFEAMCTFLSSAVK